MGENKEINLSIWRYILGSFIVGLIFLIYTIFSSFLRTSLFLHLSFYEASLIILQYFFLSLPFFVIIYLSHKYYLNKIGKWVFLKLPGIGLLLSMIPILILLILGFMGLFKGAGLAGFVIMFIILIYLAGIIAFSILMSFFVYISYKHPGLIDFTIRIFGRNPKNC